MMLLVVLDNLFDELVLFVLLTPKCIDTNVNDPWIEWKTHWNNCRLHAENRVILHERVVCLFVCLCVCVSVSVCLSVFVCNVSVFPFVHLQL